MLLSSSTPRLFAVGVFSTLVIALPLAGRPANTIESVNRPVMLAADNCQTNQNYGSSSPCYNPQTNVRNTTNQANAAQRHAQLTCATGDASQCGPARSNANRAQSLRSGAIASEQTSRTHR